MRALLTLASLGACMAGKASLSTPNLVSSLKDVSSIPDMFFGGLKASYDKKVSIGSEDIKLGVVVEAKSFDDLLSADNIKEVSASGSYTLDAAQPEWNGHDDCTPFKLGYSLAHKFKNGVTALKLSAATYGASLKAMADSTGKAALQSVAYGFTSKPVAGTELTVENEFELHGKWGAESVYKLTVEGWGVCASLAQPFEPVMPDIELSTKHQVAKGRAIASSISVGPEGESIYSEALLSYSDKQLQKGATWEATATQPLTKLSGTKLQLKRSWSF